MTLFGSQYGWQLRLAQAACLLVCIALTGAVASSWTSNESSAFVALSIISLLCAAIILVTTVTIEFTIRSIDRMVAQKKSDQADIADLARSAIDSSRKHSNNAIKLPAQCQALASSIKQAHKTQQNRAIHLIELSTANSELHDKLLQANESHTAGLAELFKKLAHFRQNHAELRVLTHALADGPQRTISATSELVQCKTVIVNLGIELASIVGDHPGFFNSANEALRKISQAIDTVNFQVSQLAAPREQLNQKAIVIESGLLDFNKCIGDLKQADALLEQLAAHTELFPSPKLASKLAGEAELQSIADSAATLEATVTKYVAEQQSGGDIATRAVTVIDRVAARRPAVQRPSMEIPLNRNQPMVLPEFHGDLSPASEMARKSEPRDQIEIAS